MWLLVLVTGNRWKVTSDMWHLKRNNFFYSIIFFYHFNFIVFLVLLILFACVNRFSVCCMQYFYSIVDNILSSYCYHHFCLFICLSRPGDLDLKKVQNGDFCLKPIVLSFPIHVFFLHLYFVRIIYIVFIYLDLFLWFWFVWILFW